MHCAKLNSELSPRVNHLAYISLYGQLQSVQAYLMHQSVVSSDERSPTRHGYLSSVMRPSSWLLTCLLVIKAVNPK